jgi:hypothetical protein
MRRILRRPSPAMAVAFIALVLALTGTATALRGSNNVFRDDIARNAVGKSEIRSNAVGRSEAANNSIGKAEARRNSIGQSELIEGAVTGAQVLESSLGTVPNAAQLGGQGPGAFTSSGEVNVADAKLAVGQSATLATNGAVSLTAKCDLAAGLERIRVIAATTAANSFMDGNDNHNGPGGSSTTFLQPATLEDDRELLTNTTATAGLADVDNDIDDGFVLGSDGSYLAMQGETTTLGVNALGAKCFVRGLVLGGSV